MKPIWPASLRTRLLLLVTACILPVIAVAAYSAIERYRTSIGYTYDVAVLAADAVEERYLNLVSRSHDLLTLLASSTAISAPSLECSRSLAALQAQMPVYENFDVVSLQGEFVCSAVPLTQPFNASDAGWFKQVLLTHQFTSDVIPRGRITHRGLLIFSAPQFDSRGNLIGMINAAASPLALEPPADAALSRYAQITIFSSDGTVLMYYPGKQGYVGSDQSQAALFKAAVNAAGTPDIEMPGLDGKTRFYTLRYISTGAPGAGLYVASGIDGNLIKRLAFLPLLRDFSIIAVIMLFIILFSWRVSGKFVKQRVRPLLLTLQRIGAGELGARSGLAEIHGEIGAIARGVDRMAEHLEARVAAQRLAESARETSEERYKELLEQASDSIMVRHVSGELVFVNAALCKLLGYNREELLKTRVTHLVDESNLWRQRLKVGESLRFESWMRHKDGHNIPVEVSATRLSSGDIQSIQHDISQRLETQRQLHESERHYRTLVEESMLGILLRTSDGEIIFANQSLCRMCGYSRDELLSMNITGLVDIANSADIERVRRLGINESVIFQSHLRHKNGKLIYVDVSAHRLDNLNIQVMLNDVSTRVLAEQHFSDERNFVFHSLDVLPGVFYVFNHEGHFLRWNRQTEEVTGYDAVEIQRITSADLMPPELRVKHRKFVATILGGARWEGESELYCKDGRRIPYYYAVRHFKWRGEDCVVGMGVDMTERNQAEQLALAYLQEMQQLPARILESQEEERRHIARELHDELGQGLTATLLSLKTLEEQMGTSPMVEQVKHATSIITVLTQQVRDLSLNLRPSVLDDLGLVSAISWYIRERVESTGLRVVLSIDKNLPRLSALRETACFRVLQSALTNILRHAQAQKVQVGLQQADGKLVLVIQDDGLGFDVKAARRSALEGKSMGLLGMEERIRLAGGVLEISSNPGRGTVVRVVLPMS
ncbi:MAG TPA: PAS domain S-box protein [Gammaproteobacteria bacterium]|nr:PAS domain S-box protein [Gammaproteobacteria bacterium]